MENVKKMSKRDKLTFIVFIFVTVTAGAFGYED